VNQLIRTIACTLLLCTASAVASSTIAGTVLDSEGAVIAGAQISVHKDPVSRTAKAADVTVYSDSKGQFKIDVTPGFWDIFVSAPAFSPQCTKLRVSDSAPGVYTPQLHADPLVIEEFGDKF